MSYIAVTLNHFRALQEWAASRQADVRLDMKTFKVEVQHGRARFNLHPQFLNTTGGTLSYSPMLTPGATGFIGWLPYRAIQWPLSNDKLAFKDFLEGNGLLAPRRWSREEPIGEDHVLKLPAGSFGQAVFGPYRAGTDALSMPEHQHPSRERIFAEQFIVGRNVKAWFWGGVPFHLHLHAYPTVRGDGVSRIDALIARRMERADGTLPEDADKAWIVSSLAYQGWTLSDIAPEGEEIWIEYRYGRRHAPDPIQTHSDNMLHELSEAARDQVNKAGRSLHDELVKSHGVPVLFALDGVLDANDRVWWLEANSNPILPPTGYPLILATLFEDEQPAGVPARPPVLDVA
ncbi:hypothetical protein J2W23_004520 [Variovorax boronicumulans]|uniref:hypothetical protein n=1 Tax=Variovorax boronicumulans TaxID=436515 RepID=UPI002786BA3E|nr:hypothetical protein [Variovorax boronicumulans]MDQ0016119.1 hypothetical protein [Variovorax boronicumulans]